jgi:D-alanine-D-alanine ligase
MSKINLVVLLGGKSPEHNISLISGHSVIRSLDKDKYDIVVVGIDKNGQWWRQQSTDYLANSSDPARICLLPSNEPVMFSTDGSSCWLTNSATMDKLIKVDAVFPVLHGAYGEDGVVQGYFRANNVAFVGVDVMASAVGMDKDMAKRIWRDAGIAIADFEIVDLSNRFQIEYNRVVEKLGLPLFVKPANAGSSVGVSKVTNEIEFKVALDEAFKFDRKVLIEEAIQGIEVECAVLGNEFPEASVVGAIIPTETFYSYDAKYISSTGAKLEIPADISEKVSNHIRSTAIKAFKAIGGEGLSRVDFFLRPDNTIVLNEINTLPGFTSISMYPKLWEATGVPYPILLDRLIELGIDRHRQMQRLQTTH